MWVLQHLPLLKLLLKILRQEGTGIRVTISAIHWLLHTQCVRLYRDKNIQTHTNCQHFAGDILLHGTMCNIYMVISTYHSVIFQNILPAGRFCVSVWVCVWVYRIEYLGSVCHNGLTATPQEKWSVWYYDQEQRTVRSKNVCYNIWTI
jgi:hypothetical protein